MSVTEINILREERKIILPDFDGVYHRFNNMSAPIVADSIGSFEVLERLHRILLLAGRVPLRDVSVCIRATAMGDKYIPKGLWVTQIEKVASYNGLVLAFNNLNSLVRNNDPERALNFIDQQINIRL